MTAVQQAKAAEFRRNLELQKHLEALKHVETRTPVAAPKKNLEFRKSLDFKKSVEFWKSIEKRSSPDFKKKAEYRRSCSDIKQLQRMTSNEGLQYRSAVLSDRLLRGRLFNRISDGMGLDQWVHVVSIYVFTG